MKKIRRILLNLIWKNTLIGFLLTISWLILLDFYLGIGFNKYLFLEYLLITLFCIIPIVLINSVYLGVLIKKQYRFIWANIVFLIMPGALSLLYYYIIDSYEKLGIDIFYSVVYVFLFMNFLIGVLSIPYLIRKNPDLNYNKRVIRWFWILVISAPILFLIFKVLVPDQSYNYVYKIYPQVPYDIIDKNYTPPDVINSAKNLSIGYKLTWFYDCNQQYFDSVEYAEFCETEDLNSDVIDSSLYECCLKYRVESKELDSNINYQRGVIYFALANKEIDTITKDIKGVHLYLINSKPDTIELQAIDGCLFIVQEAKDILGNWRVIEQFPKSWCANSYYGVTLPPNKYFRIQALKYDGIFKTELRFKLVLNSETVLYSNPYSGGVNFGQFFINGKYLSGNIMDPHY